MESYLLGQKQFPRIYISIAGVPEWLLVCFWNILEKGQNFYLKIGQDLKWYLSICLWRFLIVCVNLCYTNSHNSSVPMGKTGQLPGPEIWYSWNFVFLITISEYILRIKSAKSFCPVQKNVLPTPEICFGDPHANSPKFPELPQSEKTLSQSFVANLVMSSYLCHIVC